MKYKSQVSSSQCKRRVRQRCGTFKRHCIARTNNFNN